MRHSTSTGLAWLGLALLAGCSSERERDLSGGGALFDGRSLSGWRVLSGEWSVADGALVGVGSRARLAWVGRLPGSYRLRFEVSPRGAGEVSWAVAVPVGDARVLRKGLFYFAGGASEWGDAWQAVEVTVEGGAVSYRASGLSARTGAGGGARFGDRALAKALWQAGLRFCERPDGLTVLALPPETWSPGSVSFAEGAQRGRRSLEGYDGGIALVVPCTTRDGREAGEGAAARFRNLVVEPLP